MNKLTENPFKFGNPVSGDYYFPRPELTNTVRQFLSNRIHVVLMGPRRFGKTSFVLDLFDHLEREGYTCILVDIFNVTSHRDFLQQFLRSLRKKQGFKSRLTNWLKKIRNLNPQLKLEIDPNSGSFTSSLGMSLGRLNDEDVRAGIQDLLEELTYLGDRVIVVLDEFQQISLLEDKGWLEATVRTHFQRLTNVSFLFTGSRKGLISEMLNDPSRPLYRSCQTIEFPSFGLDFSDWIVSRFQRVGVKCSREAVNHLRFLVQDTPNYVQMVCFHLVALARTAIDNMGIEEVLNSVAKQNAYAYQTLLTSLTLAQQRALRLAANEMHSLFQKELLIKYEISSAPALHNSIKSLKQKGILDEEGTTKGKVLFDDSLFAYWLRISFPT
ncbi:MAG: ATP-binding protein [Chlamydiia bacterium]|nr:ATP-binding protein [Chlamydiia bacterium]